MKEIRKDTFITGGDNPTQINIIHQRKMKPGPNLRKQLLDSLQKAPKTKREPRANQIEEISQDDDGFIVDTMEEAIKFLWGL